MTRPSQTALPFSQLYWPTRQLSSSLGSKQFAYEEFNVSGPTRLKITSQPLSTRKGSSFTVKVAVLDAYGEVLTLDTGPTASEVTPVSGGLDPGWDPQLVERPRPHEAVHQRRRDVDRPEDFVVGPTVQAGIYQIEASSSWPWVDEDDGLPFNVTN